MSAVQFYGASNVDNYSAVNQILAASAQDANAQKLAMMQAAPNARDLAGPLSFVSMDYQLKVLPDDPTLRRIIATELLGLTIADLEWVNTRALPMNFTTDLVTVMRKVICETPRAGAVPNLGVPRIVERHETTNVITSVRYGIAARFEFDRLSTPEGRNDFEVALAQLATIFKQNAAHDAMASIMNPDPGGKAYSRAYEPTNNVMFRELMNKERDEFGWAQKSQLGVALAFDKYAHLMKQRSGVEPDLFIADRRLLSFMNLETPINTEYQLAGPRGPKRFQQDSTIGSFRNCEVVSPPVFRNDVHETDSLPITDDSRRIGNFFTNLYRTHSDLWSTTKEKNGYRSALRTIKIYDESDNDDYVGITLMDCIRHCGRFGGDADNPDIPDAKKIMEGLVDGQKQPMKLGDLYTDKNMLTAALAEVGTTDIPVTAATFVSLDHFKKLYKADIPIPLDFIIARPWMGYNMSTAVIMKGGPETGVTNYGYVDVTTSSDGVNKSTLVNATWWLGSVIRDPKRIVHLSNIFYNGCLGGAGSKFYTDSDLRALRDKNWVVDLEDTKSLISIAIPASENWNETEVIDIAGAFNDFDGHGATKTYPTADYEITTRFGGMVSPFARIDPFRGSNGKINTVCWQGTQFNCGTEIGKYPLRKVNKGHHGAYEYPGCAIIRRGTGGFVDQMRTPLMLG